ncbi:MAG: TPM domain-containing protein [Candidatus Omnitrophica bacterium]|nr:TPM domain-containing protein [Candidatus Omnitrophota bacterium]
MQIILMLVLVAVCGTAYAEEARLPDYTGYVNDYAGILSPSANAAISSIAGQIEAKTTAQIAVVTVPTVKPLTIEQYAVELFEKWGIGQKDKDNGILILMAANDRKIRIETGYGLEGALPDAVCSQIIYQVMLPEFKRGDLEKGLTYGTIAVAELVAKEYNTTLDLGEAVPHYTGTAPVVSKKARLLRSLVYLILFIFIFGMRSGLLFFLILGPTGRRRGGHWYGSGYGGTSGGFGGGFGGFGGGFGGGGGASGGW